MVPLGMHSVTGRTHCHRHPTAMCVGGGGRGQQRGFKEAARPSAQQGEELCCEYLTCEGPIGRGMTMSMLAHSSEGRWAVPCMLALRFRVLNVESYG